MDVNEVLAEAKAHKSVSAAVQYIMTECRNALGPVVAQAGVVKDNAVAEVHALLSRGEEVAAAIMHGTPAAKDDKDPTAPPRNLQAPNVYGTLSPEDAKAQQEADDKARAEGKPLDKPQPFLDPGFQAGRSQDPAQNITSTERDPGSIQGEKGVASGAGTGTFTPTAQIADPTLVDPQRGVAEKDRVDDKQREEDQRKVDDSPGLKFGNQKMAQDKPAGIRDPSEK